MRPQLRCPDSFRVKAARVPKSRTSTRADTRWASRVATSNHLFGLNGTFGWSAARLLTGVRASQRRFGHSFAVNVSGRLATNVRGKVWGDVSR
jgi:hypothetical protein